MTEDEWLACEDFEVVFDHLESITAITQRKLRLFEVACCRRFTSRLPEPVLVDALNLAELFADGIVGQSGVLAAPPCTVFSLAGVWVYRHSDEIKFALSVVDACLRIVVAHRPKWWALENPRGLLKRYLGVPAYHFDPCDFGNLDGGCAEPWTKRTWLWGQSTPPEKCPVKPL